MTWGWACHGQLEPDSWESRGRGEGLDSNFRSLVARSVHTSFSNCVVSLTATLQVHMVACVVFVISPKEQMLVGSKLLNPETQARDVVFWSMLLVKAEMPKIHVFTMGNWHL